MDLPLFYTNSPWSYYYPLPRQRNRFPSVSRGHIYVDELVPVSQRRQTTTPPSNRNQAPSSRNNNNNSNNSRSNRHRASSTPLVSRIARPPHSRAMQASTSASSSPHLWPSHTTDNKPSMSFLRAARELSTTLNEALAYFKPFYSEFKDETREIRTYADQAVIDQIWMKKILSSAGVEESGNGDGTDTAGEGEHGAGDENGYENEHQTESETEPDIFRDFRDHQAAVFNRCEDLLCAVPPPQTRGSYRSTTSSGGDSDRSLEATVLVAKMGRCREDLFPALRRMRSRYVVVGTAIKEMEVLRSNLETYREVWDGGEGRG
jgi:hypothetical protein